MKGAKIIKTLIINSWLIVFVILLFELGSRLQPLTTSQGSINLKKIQKLLSGEGPGALSASDMNQTNKQRYPHPYQMFKGKPNELDHNSKGYRFSEDIPKYSLRIAFFGGSTGYGGKPPIADLLTKRISTRDNKFYALNYSVVSSNHNQHLHSLVENFDASKTKQFDLVVFYGGYNETAQTLAYPADSRPGYPYNFYIRNEAPIEFQFFYKHSKLFRNFVDKNRYLEKILYFKHTPYSTEWNQAIVNNYFETIHKAKIVSEALTSEKCKTKFIAIYQPYNYKAPFLRKDFEDEIHNNIRQRIKSEQHIIDISDLLPTDSPFYTDQVHVSQEGKELIAEYISQNNQFKSIIDGCTSTQHDS